jgi:subfamily B ATP-binding cassette protein MsbA
MSAVPPSNSLASVSEAELENLKMPYRRLLPYLRPWLGRFFLGSAWASLRPASTR